MDDTFALRITFSGLCMYTWEGQAGATRAHVLLPATLGSPQHVACIAYDAGHESPAAIASKRLSFVWPQPGTWLVFPGSNQQPLSQPVSVAPWPDSILDLEAYARKPLSTALLTSGDPRVKFRAVMDAGHASRCDMGGPWTMGSEADLYLAFRVTWTIPGIPTAAFDWTLYGPTVNVALPRLHPIGGAVDLFVFHTVDGDVPPVEPLPFAPHSGYRADHVAMLYNLFDHPANANVPIAPDEMGGLMQDAGMMNVMMATTSTCMGGLASMAPTSSSD